MKKKEIFEILAKNCLKDKKIPMNDPEIRKFSIFSLGKIYQTLLPINKDKIYFDIIFNTFFKTINDFTIDKRGDIGMIIRDQTMDSIYDIMTCFIKT